MRRRRTPEIIAGRVNGDGSIAAGDGFTVAYTATGIYAVTLPAGFRLIGATFSVIGNGTGIWGYNVTPGERTFTVNTMTSNTGAAAAGPFSFIAVGVQQ